MTQLEKEIKISKRISITMQNSYSYLDINRQRIHLTRISHDTFSIMKVSPLISLSWLFALSVATLQLLLFIMIIYQQSDYSVDSNDTIFNIPFNTNISIRLAQCIAIIVTVALSRDL